MERGRRAIFAGLGDEKEGTRPRAPDTLSIASIASTYQDQERWEEAEELFVQIVETFKKVLGQEHLDTLTAPPVSRSNDPIQRLFDRIMQFEVSKSLGQVKDSPERLGSSFEKLRE